MDQVQVQVQTEQELLQQQLHQQKTAELAGRAHDALTCVCSELVALCATLYLPFYTSTTSSTSASPGGRGLSQEQVCLVGEADVEETETGTSMPGAALSDSAYGNDDADVEATGKQ